MIKNKLSIFKIITIYRNSKSTEALAEISLENYLLYCSFNITKKILKNKKLAVEISDLGSTLKHQSQLTENERELMYPSRVLRENLHVNDLRTSGFFIFIHLNEEVTSCWQHHWTMLQYQCCTDRFQFYP